MTREFIQKKRGEPFGLCFMDYKAIPLKNNDNIFCMRNDTIFCILSGFFFSGGKKNENQLGWKLLEITSANKEFVVFITRKLRT